ncbi:MAG: hypothetical protein E6583_05915 [Clostridium sp.]|nr:hypothetical protein [Clostridium sp.]
MGNISDYIKIAGIIIGVILCLWFLLWIFGLRIIDNDKVGIVEKW